MSFTVEKAFELLSGAHANSRLAHAYLITGNEGCGKRHLAASLIHLLNGSGEEGDAGGLGLDLAVEETSPAPASAAAADSSCA